LVQNAREAMPAGGVVFVRAENVVLGEQVQPPLPAGDYVRVTIADQGVGIPPDMLPKIFDPYFSTKDRGSQKGMGLGLTICHSVIQKHGGAIVVKSEVGVGTTFHVYLPAVRNLSGESRATVPAVEPRHGKVLVMDDEEGVRKAVGLTLWGLGHAVELAENGELALAAYNQARSQGHPFDVVLLAVTVRGGMGGQETLQGLLKIDPTVKAIAMSSYVQNPVMLEPERYGFKSALEKPFNLGELRETISRLLGSSPDRPTEL
jgi:CheY-like chemotaxis protein